MIRWFLRRLPHVHKWEKIRRYLNADMMGFEWRAIHACECGRTVSCYEDHMPYTAHSDTYQVRLTGEDSHEVVRDKNDRIVRD